MTTAHTPGQSEPTGIAQTNIGNDMIRLKETYHE